MSQKDQGNKQSKAGEYRGKGKQKQTVKEDMYVGSSDGDGVRFPVHDHPDKSDLHSPEKG
jgi:hypothetical protein